MRIKQLDPIPDGAISPDQELAIDDPSQTFKITLSQLREFLEAHFVLKSGDTMTGALHIQPPVEAAGEAFTIRAESADLPVYLRAWAGEDLNWFIGKATAGNGVTWRSYPYGTQLELLEDQVLANKNILIQDAQSAQPNALTRKDFVEALTILCGIGSDIVPTIPSFLVANKGGIYKALGAGTTTPTPGVPPGTGNNTVTALCIPISTNIQHYVAVENSGDTPGKLWHGTNQGGAAYWTQVHTDAAPSAATLELKSEVDQLRAELAELRAMLPM